MIYILFQIMLWCPISFSHWSNIILTCSKNSFVFIFELGNSWEILLFDLWWSHGTILGILVKFCSLHSGDPMGWHWEFLGNFALFDLWWSQMTILGILGKFHFLTSGDPRWRFWEFLENFVFWPLVTPDADLVNSWEILLFDLCHCYLEILHLRISYKVYAV